jgi:dTDP-4-amino-4,6-dideoxygalactose transaminase
MSTEKRIYLSPPHLGIEEMKFVQEAFATNWVSPAGPHLDAFEKELATYNGVDFCAAVSSGTAAIHLALILLGIKQGDEVICSSFTFSGSCNPIAYQGATPIFVDSEEQTWNMCPEMMKEAIHDRIKKGKKPKAIIAVHLYGMPCKISEIMDTAKQFEIPVIEDAAEALGSTYRGQKLGSFGDIGIFSFNGNKIITTSGGGAMISRNKEWIQKAKFLSTQARDQAPHYQHSEIGYNYRLSNVCAGIGRGQLKVIDERVLQRRLNFDFYKKELGQLLGVTFQPEAKGNYSNRWLTCLTLDTTKSKAVTCEKIRLALEDNNIESRPLWKPMHLQPVFRDAPFYGSSVSENLFNAGLCLPSGSSLSLSDLQKIAAIIKQMFPVS